MPWYLVHSPFMQVEVGILQIHCQGSSPFVTHPMSMWTFLFAMFIHYGTALYYARCWLIGSRRSKLCDLIGYISGSLTSAAFLSILVPSSLVPLIFIICILQLPLYFDDARDRIWKVVQSFVSAFSTVWFHMFTTLRSHIIEGNN